MFRTSDRSASRRQFSCFTIVEIIVVLVIISIAAGMGIAAYRSAGHHQGSRAGAQRMADMIALARQKAILENTRVALLLPQMNTSGLNSRYFQTGDVPGNQVGFCEVDKTGNFVKWIEGAPWMELPKQTYFTVSNLWTVSGVDLPDTAATTSNAIIFLSNGTLQTNKFKTGGELWVKPFSTSSSRYDPGSAYRYSITINWLTGATTTASQGG